MPYFYDIGKEIAHFSKEEAYRHIFGFKLNTACTLIADGY
jgi:hypothetical protein